MRDTFKKLTGTLVAALLIGATAAGCSGGYTPKKLAGDISGNVDSNGGFVVTKGEYVYFINGSEEYTAKNTYGKVEKGALMRISKADLKAKNYAKAETVVPALFVSQNHDDGGVYIYGDYVYFASPTTEKEFDGSISNEKLNFKRAKLDGSSTEKEIKEYFYRSESNSIAYRYVEVGKTVYLMYVDGTSLYSLNTATGKNTLLVEGAETYYFDSSDSVSAEVYYTMGVTQDIDTANSYTVKYNQLYSVTADATATVKVSGGKAGYEVKGYKSYEFDKAYLEDNVDGFKADDYTTYPYVNLGKLVLDGRGYGEAYKDTVFNDDDTAPKAPHGYTYAVQSYQNGGVYYTRTDANATSSDTENTKLYYLADSVKNAEGWKSVAGNSSTEIDVVALNTTEASSSAIFEVKEESGVRTHSYIYADTTANRIYKVETNAKGGAETEGSVKEKFWIVPSATSVTLLDTDGTYLYYYAAGSNGNNLSRVDYTGSKGDYDAPVTDEKFEALTILDVDWNSAWYKPEMIENILFYSNAKAFGSKTYNYVYTVDMNGANGLMTTKELKEFNEKYEEVNKYIDEFSSDHAALQKALKYYFRTGETTAYDEFIAEAKAKGYKEHYRYDEYSINEFKAFTTHTKSENEDANDYTAMFGYDANDTSKYYGVESYYTNLLGVMTDADKKEIEAVWRSADYIEPLPAEAEAEDNSKTAWLVVGIVAGVLAVAAAITVPVVIHLKKKAKLAADREATAIRKPKIDTTDDKSIDVYADDEETVETTETAEESETVEETSVEAVETEATEEAPVEEAPVAPVEETPAETTENTEQ
ncbi:MAG: hypothetical protein IJY62_04615 [Clostridia bacterium]|nr:hypothetical protein [Clostridia bacterium]